ncbi:hypothetical protein AY606_13445 [Acinetobacter sp. SFB]|uniref:hypothetical protein n=1 Tax=Acinetobacter sp. SFB TaxID=1805634 RepID=UPI0007D877D8|nr:hypothetical protein [Acinetobacter sp. SFB]OAL75733.1 hypothetical protein AY606_13445 [Acinetobacter sp. SFB]
MSKNVGLKLSTVALAVMLASCGGGGSEGYYNQEGSSNNSGNNGNSNETIESKNPVNIGEISLLDASNTTTYVVTPDGVMALVQVTDQTGKGIPNALVRFQGESIVLGTSNGAVLTDSNGYARISLNPSSNNLTGAYQLSATTEFNNNSAISKVLNFTIADRQTSIKNLNVSANNINSGGSLTVTLDTLDPVNNSIQDNVEINFNANCGTFENAVINSVNGKIATKYFAVSAGGVPCVGSDVIKASTKDGKSVSTIGITVNALPPNAIVYSSQETLLYTNTSGQSTSGYVEFTLKLDDKVIPNQNVDIEILRGPDDLNFVNKGNRNATTVPSDNNGIVRVYLYPGAKPGPVEIKASLASDSSIFAVSRGLSVGTGRVTQRGLSLSVSKNALDNTKDGDTAEIVARMVDRVGNPVPDGTAITFITEGGSIDTRCLTSAGSCVVTLSTQNPRPADNRVSVLAYVEGEKSFIDVDGTNVWNKAVTTLLHNIGSFYRDDDEDGMYDQGEYKYTREGGNQACQPKSAIDFPVLRFPNIENTCDDKLDAVIREQLIFSFSPDTAKFRSEKATLDSSELSFEVFGNTQYSVPMPSGSTVKVEADDTTDNNKSCSSTLWFGNETVPAVFDLMSPTSFASSSQVYYSYRIKDCAVGDKFTITVVAPNGQVSKKQVVVTQQ